MQRDTFISLSFVSVSFSGIFLGGVLLILILAVSGCGGNKQIAIKPDQIEPLVQAVTAEEERVEAVAETADLPLTDPSPERLVLSARYGQADSVRYLLDGGMDVNAKDAYNNTALIAAASNGQTKMVQLLLERGANVNAANKKELTALMGAAVKGNYDLVHHLISAGADVNYKNDEGETALFMAVQYGHYKAAKVLLNAGSNPNLHNTVRANFPNSGFTPLMYAASHGLTREQVDWAAIAQLLIDNGADPNRDSTHGEAALSYARNKNDADVITVLKRAGAKDEQIYAGLNADESLIKAARMGDITKARQLLADGANPNFTDKNGVTPLLAAAHEGQSIVLQALLDAGVEVNFVPSGLRQFAMSKSHAPLSERELMEAASRGETALNAAVRQGHVDAVDYLLKHDAKIDLANRHGETPLLVAASAGNLEMVKRLLDNGADPNSVEQDNRRNRLALAKHAMGRDSVLILAVQKGHLDISQALIKAGADVDYRGFLGKTALYAAVENGRRNLLQLLVEQKADANINSLPGITPLMEAATMGNRHMVEDLLVAGADVNIIEKPDLGYAREAQSGGSTGMTALMFAVRGGHDEVVKQLLQARAETNIHNSNGESALEMARNGGYENIIQLLASGAASDSITLNAVEN